VRLKVSVTSVGIRNIPNTKKCDNLALVLLGNVYN